MVAGRRIEEHGDAPEVPRRPHASFGQDQDSRSTEAVTTSRHSTLADEDLERSIDRASRQA